MSVVKGFLRNIRGNMGITFIVLSAAVTGAVAFGIETARLASNKTFMQDLSDSAALYGATLVTDPTLSDADISTKVNQWMAAQLNSDDLTLDPSGAVVTVDRNRKAVRVEAHAELELMLPFLSLSDPIALTALTEAGVSENDPPSGPGLCGLALDNAAQKAMRFQGDGTIAATDCVFWSNSQDNNATHGFGSGETDASKVCSVGSYTSAGGYTVLPPPEDKCAPLNDPYADWKHPVPNWNNCDYGDASGASFDGGGYDVTLSPGVYCGGLTITKARNVIFRPGKYFIGGKTNVVASGTISGTGVYMHFPATDLSIDFTADKYDLKRSGEASLANVLIYKEPGAAKKSHILFQAYTDFQAEGAFYFPSDDLEFRIASAASAPEFDLALIAETIDLNIARGSVFHLSPLVRIVNGSATRVATALHLLK